MEAAGEDVQQKAAHEFSGVESHDLVASVAPRSVVLPAKRDPIGIEGHESPIGNRHPMGIAGQVGQYRLWSSKGAFGVDHPFAVSQGCKPVREGASIGQRSIFAEELESARLMFLAECFEEAPTKVAGEDPYWQEESGFTGNPTVPVGR